MVIEPPHGLALVPISSGILKVLVLAGSTVLVVGFQPPVTVRLEFLMLLRSYSGAFKSFFPPLIIYTFLNVDRAVALVVWVARQECQ